MSRLTRPKSSSASSAGRCCWITPTVPPMSGWQQREPTSRGSSSGGLRGRLSRASMRACSGLFLRC
eukprot:3949326-Prymnesium_polylepis.1